MIPNQRTSGIANLATNLVTVGDWQFALWYTLADELRIGRIVRGAQTWGVDHDEYEFAGAPRTVLGLPVPFDEHNYPAVAVDGNGRLHVWANMHNDTLRYVRTVNPHTTGGWLADAGWVDASSEMAGAEIDTTYPTPVQLPDGGMWFYIRTDTGPPAGTGASDSKHWTRGPTDTEWTERGLFFQGNEVPDAGGPGIPGSGADDSSSRTNWNAYPTVPYVESGRDPHPGRMHMSWCWKIAPFEQGTTNVMPGYAYSDDGGVTWQAIDGTVLTLPVTPLNNLACRIPGSAFVKDIVRASGIVVATLDTADHGITVGDQIEVWCVDLGFEGVFTVGALVGDTGVAWGQAGADTSSYGGAVVKTPRLLNWGAIAVDGGGLPHMFVSNNGGTWFHRDDTNTGWVRETVANPVAGVTRTGRCGGVFRQRGGLWLLTSRWPNLGRRVCLTRADGQSGDVTLSGNVGTSDPDVGGWEPTFDREAWRLFGVIETLVPDGDRPRVFTFGGHARARAAA